MRDRGIEELKRLWRAGELKLADPDVRAQIRAAHERKASTCAGCGELGATLRVTARGDGRDPTTARWHATCWRRRAGAGEQAERPSGVRTARLRSLDNARGVAR